MMRKTLSILVLAGCYAWGLPAMADEMPVMEPAAVDESLLLPPSLEEQVNASSATTTSVAAPDSGTQTSSTAAAISQSKAATVNILQELDRRAKAGDAACQFQLGYLYANGKGVRQDDQEAVHWFRQSALKGNVNGLIAMAEAFDLGRGVSQNPIAAYALAKAAVALKPEASVVADQLKTKLSANGLTKAEGLSVQDALKLR